MKCSLRLRYILVPLLAVVIVSPSDYLPGEVTARAASSAIELAGKVPATDTTSIVPVAQKRPKGRYAHCQHLRDLKQTASGKLIRRLGYCLAVARFGKAQWPYLRKLWSKESGWSPLIPGRKARHNWRNRACGIPQVNPCTRLKDRSPYGQIMWGLGNISGRYGSPAKAWRTWQRQGWY